MSVCASFELPSHSAVAGDRAGARERLNLPQHGPAAVVLFVSAQRIDEQSLFAIRPQARVGGKYHAFLGPAREQVHELHRQLLDFGQIPRFVVSHENDVEVGTVNQFLAAEFAQADDGEGRRFQFVFA